MLSHPTIHEADSNGSSSAPEFLPTGSPNQGRAHVAFQKLLRKSGADFLKKWLIAGPIRLFQGEFTRRTATFAIAAALPSIITVTFLTLPGILFVTPEHHEFYYFAKNLELDAISFLPVTIGAISTVFGLRISAEA